MNTDYDLIIIGGGMVGASLALALAQQPLRIALIEAVPYRSETQPNYDDRALALAEGTRRIFAAMGVWEAIAPHATAIERIHVSDQGHLGVARLDCHEENVPALGYVITARALGHALVGATSALPNLSLISPAKVVDLQLGTDHATAIIDQDGQRDALTAKLIVAADGGDSTVRGLLDIPTTEHDYQQTAIIANLTTQRPHRHVAYERFTPHGPLALLPLDDARCALVWTRAPKDAERILSLDDDAFLSELQADFGMRLGRFTKVGARAAHPLRLVQAREQVRQRLALIGNAAHTLHPIAGQGFNLGLRDVAALAQVLTDACETQHDIGGQDVLNAYAQWRARDHRQVIGFTNTLVRTFSNRFPPLALARNLGLLALDTLPPIKHQLARHAMGLGGKLPRLARGLML